MINSENKELSITHDNEIAYVLSRFNQDFIYNTVTEAIGSNIRYYDFVAPNIVNGYEEVFKQTLNEYPDFKQDILDKREEVYTNIIKIICDHFQLVYDDHDQYDLYSSASMLYHTFVSSYQTFLVNFFFNFICAEKDQLYDSLNLAELKKNKDLTSTYIKKNTDAFKISAICSCIDLVMKSICSLDIPFERIVEKAYEGDNVISAVQAKHINDIISPRTDFLNSYVLPLLESDLGIALYNAVRMLLVKWAGPVTDISSLISKEGNNG